MEADDSLSRVPVWTDAYWGTSVPRVHPGSPVFYVERSWGAMKGMVYVARQTVFTRYDLATCHKTGEKTFSGSAEVAGWGALPGQIWIRAESDRDRAQSFDGATRAASELDPPRAAPMDNWLDQIVARDDAQSVRSPSRRLAAYAEGAACGREVTVVDVPSGKVVVKRTFDTCVQPTRWTDDEMHLLVFHYEPPNHRSWSLAVPDGGVVELPAEAERSTPRAVEIGDTLFYADGPSEAPHLGAVNLATGQRWDVTKPLRRIDILVAEPQARKLILTVDTSVVLTYDLAKATLTQCKL